MNRWKRGNRRTITFWSLSETRFDILLPSKTVYNSIVRNVAARKPREALCDQSQSRNAINRFLIKAIKTLQPFFESERNTLRRLEPGMWLNVIIKSLWDAREGSREDVDWEWNEKRVLEAMMYWISSWRDVNSRSTLLDFLIFKLNDFTLRLMNCSRFTFNFFWVIGDNFLKLQVSNEVAFCWEVAKD